MCGCPWAVTRQDSTRAPFPGLLGVTATTDAQTDSEGPPGALGSRSGPVLRVARRIHYVQGGLAGGAPAIWRASPPSTRRCSSRCCPRPGEAAEESRAGERVGATGCLRPPPPVALSTGWHPAAGTLGLPTAPCRGGSGDQGRPAEPADSGSDPKGWACVPGLGRSSLGAPVPPSPSARFPRAHVRAGAKGVGKGRAVSCVQPVVPGSRGGSGAVSGGRWGAMTP